MTLLKSLAATYGVVLGLTRESTQAEVKAAYRKVSRKANPDQGGTLGHQNALTSALGAWEEALRVGAGRGGDRTAKKTPDRTAPSRATDTRTVKAQSVAKAKFRNFKAVCQEVIKKKGAMSRQ